jgi:predicted Zn finger-like uncharacterized protein
MAITLTCPSCSRSLRVPDELVGKAVRCPSCLTTFSGTPQPAAAPVPAGAPTGPTAPAPDPTAVLPNLSLDERRSPGPASGAVIPDEPAPAPPSPAPPKEKARPETHPCPACGEQIGVHDERCRYCGEDVTAEEERPWERRSRRPVRRDCEPHRGPLLLVLGIVSLVVAPMVMCCYFVGPLVPLVGLILAVVAWVLGRRDLEKMKQGVMDPEGEGVTQGGMICGIIGTVLNALGILFGTVMLVYIVLMMTSIARMPPPGPPPAAPVRPPPAPKAPPPAPNPNAPAPGGG